MRRIAPVPCYVPSRTVLLGGFTAALLAASTAGVAQEANPNPTRMGVQDPLDQTGLQPHVLRETGTGQVTAGTAFNPEMSIIFDGVYYNELSGRRHDPAGFEGGHGHGHDHGHDHGHGLSEGFNLRETEFAFSASVDPYFDAFAMLVVEGTDHIDLEEAYITTRQLPAGLQLKAGRFLSDVGYINKQHPHEWDFVDRPLMNEFLFGDHGLQETGLQLSWTPATPFYSRFGVEVLQGETDGVANHVGHPSAVAGTERILDDAAGPRLATAFSKFAPNLGYSHALQFGLFGGYARSYQNTDEHSTRFEDWEGDAWFAGTDWVYKYDAGRSQGHRDFTLQAEYMYREVDVDRLDVYFEDDNGIQAGDTANEQSFRNRHDGAYVQATYGIAPRWDVGLRYDALGLTNEIGRGDGETFGRSDRYALQVSFMPSHFSRLRAQVNYNDFYDDDHGEREGSWELMVQYNMSLGVHGAHSF